jgi:hypothetical protein
VPKSGNVRLAPEAAKALHAGEESAQAAGDVEPTVEAPAKPAKKAKKKDEEA